jgi:hypothetical protein
MKRSLGCSDDDRLNFFRLYDGCLMDVAVISWCKLFGANSEQSHWKRLFPDHFHEDLRVAISDSVGGKDVFYRIWEEISEYRNKYVAHHEFNERHRPQQHPQLEPLRQSGLVLYARVHEALRSHGAEHGLPHPTSISGEVLAKIEEHWCVIADTAREALRGFSDNLNSGALDQA